PNRPLPHLGGVLFRSRHDSNLSKVGASGKPRAVQLSSGTRHLCCSTHRLLQGIFCDPRLAGPPEVGSGGTSGAPEPEVAPALGAVARTRREAVRLVGAVDFFHLFT